MAASHARKVNGFSTSEFRAMDDLSVGETIAGSLGRMDGTGFYSWLLWRLPPGRSLEQVIRTVASGQEPSSFMQCAGSSSAMTVEIREAVNDDGAPILFTVGKRLTGPATGGGRIEIPWDTNVVRVEPHEVFTAEQAAELFVEYFETNTVSGTCTRRQTL